MEVETILAKEIEKQFDAVVLATGATIKREMPIPGSELEGVIQAMDFLPHNNRAVDGQHARDKKFSAKGLNVVVIGGVTLGQTALELQIDTELKV